MLHLAGMTLEQMAATMAELDIDSSDEEVHHYLQQVKQNKETLPHILIPIRIDISRI